MRSWSVHLHAALLDMLAKQEDGEEVILQERQMDLVAIPPVQYPDVSAPLTQVAVQGVEGMPLVELGRGVLLEVRQDHNLPREPLLAESHVDLEDGSVEPRL